MVQSAIVVPCIYFFKVGEKKRETEAITKYLEKKKGIKAKEIHVDFQNTLLHIQPWTNCLNVAGRVQKMIHAVAS